MAANGHPPGSQVKAQKLSGRRGRRTIRDGVTFTWLPAYDADPVVLHISGDEMSKNLPLRTTETGLVITRESGDYNHVAYVIKADTAEQMATRILRVFRLLGKHGYKHSVWMKRGVRESMGIGVSIEPQAKNKRG